MKITRHAIKKILIHITCKRFQHLINERKRKMILSGGIIESHVINTHLPSYNYSCWGKFISLILYNGHASFLMHHLSRTHPCTIKYWVSNSCIENLNYLCLHHFFHVQIELTLRLNVRIIVIPNQNFMNTAQRTDSLNI